MSSGLAIAVPLARGEAAKSGTSRQTHVALASLSLFIGLSAANAIGGVLQYTYFGLCLGVLLLRRHRIPLGILGGVILCATIAALASLQIEFSITPVLRFVRPFVEGYMLAVLLYQICNIRTLESLLAALAGYVAIELTSAMAMAVLPDVRLSLLDLWYGDESYDGQALRAALLFRGFGVSRHHLFGLPLALGTISTLLLAGANLERRPLRRTLLTGSAFACMLLIMPNARIGLVPILAFYVLGISLFFSFFYLRQLLVVLGIGIPLLLLLVKMYLGDAGEALVDWMFEGAMQFIDTSQASDATTVSDLSNMIILPTEPLAWIIGEGRICQPGETCYSDIGWIRLLQEGGLILTTMVALVYFRLILKIHTNLYQFGIKQPLQIVRASQNLLLWVLSLTFVAATIKGDAYAPNDYSRLLMTIYILIHQLQHRSVHIHATHSTSPTT